SGCQRFHVLGIDAARRRAWCAGVRFRSQQSQYGFIRLQEALGLRTEIAPICLSLGARKGYSRPQSVESEIFTVYRCLEEVASAGSTIFGALVGQKPGLGVAMAEILYLCHRIPYPPNKGDKIRAFNWLRALADKNTVHYGSFVDYPQDW